MLGGTGPRLRLASDRLRAVRDHLGLPIQGDRAAGRRDRAGDRICTPTPFLRRLA